MWSSQSPDLNTAEVLWPDLKQVVYTTKPFHSDGKDLLPVITNSWLQLLLAGKAQPVIRFRGNYFLTPGLFPSIKLKLNVYLVLTLKLV